MQVVAASDNMYFLFEAALDLPHVAGKKTVEEHNEKRQEAILAAIQFLLNDENTRKAIKASVRSGLVSLQSILSASYRDGCGHILRTNGFYLCLSSPHCAESAPHPPGACYGCSELESPRGRLCRGLLVLSVRMLKGLLGQTLSRIRFSLFLTHLLTRSLAYALTCLLAHLLTCSLAHLLTCSLAHLLTRSLAYSLTCSRLTCSHARLQILRISESELFSQSSDSSFPFLYRAIVTLMQSWSGFIMLAAEGCLKIVVSALTLPSIDIKDAVLDTIFHIIQAKVPEAGAVCLLPCLSLIFQFKNLQGLGLGVHDFSTIPDCALCHQDPFAVLARTQTSGDSTGLTGADGRMELPPKTKRHNLLDNFMAAQLQAFIEEGLVEVAGTLLLFAFHKCAPP